MLSFGSSFCKAKVRAATGMLLRMETPITNDGFFFSLRSVLIGLGLSFVLVVNYVVFAPRPCGWLLLGKRKPVEPTVADNFPYHDFPQASTC